MTRGVLYIASGEEYVSEAATSARSVKNELPDENITIVTDVANVPDVFDTRLELTDPDHSNFDKVTNISRSPYDKTVFLDTDTYLHVESGLDDIFSLLDEFDFAACHALGRRLEIASSSPTPDVPVPDSFAWFNSGVLAFTSDSAVDRMFEEWERIFLSHRRVNSHVLDQESLRQVLYFSDLRIATLPPEYNYRVLYPAAVGDTARLFHAHIDNFEEVANTVNREPETIRYFHAVEGGRTAYLWTPTSIGTRARLVYLSLKERGILDTGIGLLSHLRGGEFWPE